VLTPPKVTCHFQEHLKTTVHESISHNRTVKSIPAGGEDQQLLAAITPTRSIDQATGTMPKDVDGTNASPPAGAADAGAGAGVADAGASDAVAADAVADAGA
jgi:hypothetical protein